MDNSSQMFTGLPAPSRKRWKYVGYALLGESLALAVLIQAGLISPSILQPRERSVTISLAVPVPVPHEVQKVPPRLVQPLHITRPRPVEVAISKLPPPPMPDVPKPDLPRIETRVPTPKPAVSDHPVFATVAKPKTEPKPGPEVAVGAFHSSGSSATPTTALTAHLVQTGGFGDPNGVPADKNSHGPANVASLGSFDLPAGGGHGNGTGGTRGARGVVLSAGFGNGEAAPGGGGTGMGATVRSSGFDAAPAPKAARRDPELPRTPEMTAAEVLSKPVPVYTPEARALKLQGEVLLDVVFSASGKVEVLRVVRGLGHGLDEAAVQAAQHIKFKPATRAGSPVDSKATLHIVFQLA